ncbi:IS481 family transposase [Tepidimonas sp.]|uniref:IS481 family transposase n=1 Tax=Tepidimonas sp. TaxID=2002775 RepID=UPI00391AB4A6
MIVRLHKLARTTPAIRAEIAASNESIQTLADRCGVSPMTVFKWKHRTSFEDRPHTPHRLPTTLTAAQEIIAVELRKTLWLSLNDLLAVMREFVNPQVSRSGLDRCLRRHGVSNLRALQPQGPKAKHGTFAVYEPGDVHIDVSAQAARAFLAALAKACPVRIRTILTDHGKAFTDRFVTTGERAPTGPHAFDALCDALGIEHRLTRARRPQTHGMVQRFNGRIEEVLRSHHLPQSALHARTPMQAMKERYEQRPDLFQKRPHNLPGHDSYRAMAADKAREAKAMEWCNALAGDMADAAR